jgi:hypothetical protein
MKKELCSLIGLLLSDGSVYYDKSKGTYCIQFTNKFESMRNYFKSLVTKLFGTVRFSENRCKNAFLSDFSRKKLLNFYFNSLQLTELYDILTEVILIVEFPMK